VDAAPLTGSAFNPLSWLFEPLFSFFFVSLPWGRAGRAVRKRRGDERLYRTSLMNLPMPLFFSFCVNSGRAGAGGYGHLPFPSFSFGIPPGIKGRGGLGTVSESHSRAIFDSFPSSN